MTRWLPLIIVALGLGVGGGLRAWVQQRRIGSWGVLLFRDRRPSQMARDLAVVAIGLALTAQAVLVAARPGTETAGSSVPWPLGLAVALLGLLVMCVAQLQLGAAWRIGIDWAARPGLVSQGLYRWSRNPVFAGLLLAMAGYALLLPTAISGATLAVAALALRGQVLEEERYLAVAYGPEFREYARRVGRFIPGIGRLRTANTDQHP